jgi:TRAP-type C4-dicarboxylate transport system substrate-binding protein
MKNAIAHAKVLRPLVFFFALLTAFTGLAIGQTRIKLGTLVPKGTSYHRILLEMGEKWRQAPDGGVTTSIYADGNMGSEPDLVRRMRVGQIQAAMLTVSGLGEIDPGINALQEMPMMYHSLDEADYVREKLQPALERRILDKGFVVLFWGDVGWVRFFSKEPAYEPKDFLKMKLFVGNGDNDQIELMKAAGYQVVPLEWSDVLTSLQTGLVDVVPTVPFHALAGQFFGSTRHMLEVDWVPLVGATVITKKAWDSMSPAKQDFILKTAIESGKQMEANSRKENDLAVEAMKKRGMQVHPVPSTLEAEWRKFAETVYPKIRGHMVPADTFDEVQRLLVDYRRTAKPEVVANSGGKP